MDIKEIRDKKSEELKALLTEKQDASRELRFGIYSKQAKNNREYRNCRRDVARIMTVLNNNESK